MKNLDLYKELEVNKKATQEDIKKSYKKLAMKWHPDKNHNKEIATEKFQKVTFAYSILGDIEKRKNYDLYGITEDVEEESFSEFMKHFNMGDDLFDMLFNNDITDLDDIEDIEAKIDDNIQFCIHLFDVKNESLYDVASMINIDNKNRNHFNTFIYRQNDKQESISPKNNKEYGYSSINELYLIKNNKVLKNILKQNNLNQEDWEFLEDIEEISSDSETCSEQSGNNNKNKKKKKGKKNNKEEEFNDFFNTIFGGKKSAKKKKSNNESKNNNYTNTNNTYNTNTNSKNDKFKGLKEDVFRKFIEDNTDENNTKRFTCKICKGPKTKFEYAKIKDHFIDKHEKEYKQSKYASQADFCTAIDYSDFCDSEEVLKEKESQKNYKDGNKNKKKSGLNIDDFTEEDLYDMMNGMDDNLEEELFKMMMGTSAKGKRPKKR